MAIIEMKARRQHSLDQIKGWFDMRYATFVRPMLKAGNRMRRADSDGSILMPSHGPIHLGRLVK